MALTRLELTARPFKEGRSFGEAGPYEELEGRAHFALDPGHTLNKVITDLGLAPPGEDGRVHFSADLVLLRPQQPARGNRRLLIDIPNRGRTTAVRMLDIEPAEPLPTGRPVAGDGWLLQRGYTIACCGWQHDVPLGRGLLGISVPEAVIDGKPVEGRLMFEFQPAAPAQSVMLSSNIAETVHRPYPAKDLEDPTAVLLVRDHAFGPAEVIGRDRWSFARSEAGRIVPDPTHVYCADGFEPGRRYEVVYTAVGAPLTGLGFAATRDLASFLRYGSVEDGNPCAGHLEHTRAFGASQSGRFLRQLLYLGLYRDEKGRMALDGLLPHIAGGRMTEANWRFGQPSYLGPSSVINLFPFSDAVQTDTATGRTDGLQSRANASGKAPKMMYVNSSAEYWGSQAGLVHSALDSGADVVPPDNVRVYHLTGTQHVGAPLPLTDTRAASGSRGGYFLNSIDYWPLVRAALTSLDAWVSLGTEPPPSRYPRVSEGTAVDRESLRERLARIPDVRLPARLLPVAYLDFGIEQDVGLATLLPPELGPMYRALVSDIDDDGNELSGVRHPEIAVPLATYTGWNSRHPDIGAADQALFLAGATLPFTPDAAERGRKGDPRPAIEERYPSKGLYLEEVEAAALELVRERYLLEDDVETIVRLAGRRYDEFIRLG